MIAVRVIFGPLFDKFDKAVLTAGSLLILAFSLILLATVDSSTHFYGAATIYGIGIGAATPLMNGLMFTLSRPIYRGLNTNLMLEMLDVGCFLGPAACGIALVAGLGQTAILSVCALIIILAAGLMIPLMKLQTEEE